MIQDKPQGIDLEREMLAKARAGGFRIIGPNCVGLYVPKSRLLPFFNLPPEPGPAGIPPGFVGRR